MCAQVDMKRLQWQPHLFTKFCPLPGRLIRLQRHVKEEVERAPPFPWPHMCKVTQFCSSPTSSVVPKREFFSVHFFLTLKKKKVHVSGQLSHPYTLEAGIQS